MHSSLKKPSRILALGIVFLVLAVSLTSEALHIASASSLPQHTAAQGQGVAKAAASAPSNTAVKTYKQDNNHTGDQTNETILNTSNVNASSFGKRVSYPVDGQVYAQPLYLPNVMIGGVSHNVVYVATENDSIYAFDADQTSAVAPLWHINFLDPPNVVAASNTDVSCNDLVPEIGITGTPVIDQSAGIIYVITYANESGTLAYRLHALNLTTGQEEPGSPLLIQATVPGTGVDSVGGKVTFNAQRERQRSALILSDGNVYIAWASFCDDNPYHGWIMSYNYNGSQFQQLDAYNDTANSTRGGIWGAGGGISADSSGNIYYVSGNGGFDASTGGPDYGDSFVKLSPQLKELDYFSPFNQQCLDSEDADLGSGGALLVPGQNRIIGAGKEGRIYVVDTTNMGGYTAIANPCSNQSLTNVDKVLQELPPSTIGGLYSNSTYWKNASGQQFVYFAGANDNAKAFTLTSGGTLSPSPFSQTPEVFGFTGGNPTISSNNGAAGTGILWTLDPTPALRAYDATNLSTELYNSTQNSARDGVESYTKFSAPTVANGEVFLGTKSTLDIYGLLVSSTTPPTGSPTPTPTGTPVAGPGYNNIGVSNDDATKIANFDGKGNSYSAEALGTDGISSGGVLTANGFAFTWPNVAVGSSDDYVANGETIPINPVNQADHLAFLGSSANGSASGPATITYTDGSTQSFTLGFTDWAAKTLAFGNSVVAVMPYRNTAKGQQTINMYLYVSSVTLQAGKTVQSVTLPSAVTGGQMHVFAVSTSSLTSPIYNNVGIADDGTMNPGFDSDNGNIAPVSYDGVGYGYSAQALQTAGITPGWTVVSNGFTFMWPDVASDEADNYLVDGQQLAVTPLSHANQLALLGSATNGATSGTATITYTDGSTQTFTLGFTDWASKTLSFGNKVVVTMPYRDNAAGAKQSLTMYVFLASVTLQAGKTVQSVTLPSAVTGGQMHVFAVSTSSPTASVYNNAGITNTGNVGPGNFDGSGNSYSAQALQSVGVNAGDNAFDPTRTVVFTWPPVPAGTTDNYQCTGQVIPVAGNANANTLAFLGAASNGVASGTATVTYTDGTTQTFTLGFDDWTLNGGAVRELSFPNESVSYTTPFRSHPGSPNGGEQKISTDVFYYSVNIDPTKTVASVTLPSTVTGGQLHVFAITTAATSN
jgi:hypothetical protein